jgi:hypothetical protein
MHKIRTAAEKSKVDRAGQATNPEEVYKDSLFKSNLIINSH